MSIISLWFTLLSCTLQRILLISFTQFWSYIELLKLCTWFNYLISLKVTMIWVSISFWLHILTLHLWNRVEAQFIVCIIHKVLWSHNMIFKSYYIPKIPDMCIDYIFKNQSMFSKNYILVSILRKQWIRLLSVLPLKSVTLLSIIVAKLAPPYAGLPRLFG